jgi:uncharacterized protein (TIGR01741 family)
MLETKGMEQLYSEIASALVDIIPEDWENIVLYAEFGDKYRQVFFYYYPNGSNKPIYSLDITDKFNINQKQYDARETRLYNCFGKLREEFKKQGQEPWTNLTFILDGTGRMKIDYNYDEVSQLCPVERQKKWEAKYIGI